MHCDLQANPPLAYHNFEYVVAEGERIVVGGSTKLDDDDKKPADVFSVDKVIKT